MHCDAPQVRPGLFGFEWPHHKPWRANQRWDKPWLARRQSDQAYSCWLEFSFTHAKVLHMLKMCCLVCVSSVHAVYVTHLSTPLSHCMACRDTRLVCEAFWGRAAASCSTLDSKVNGFGVPLPASVFRVSGQPYLAVKYQLISSCSMPGFGSWTLWMFLFFCFSFLVVNSLLSWIVIQVDKSHSDHDSVYQRIHCIMYVSVHNLTVLFWYWLPVFRKCFVVLMFHTKRRF